MLPKRICYRFSHPRPINKHRCWQICTAILVCHVDRSVSAAVSLYQGANNWAFEVMTYYSKDFLMVWLFSTSVRWYYKRFTKDQITRKVCREWMRKDRPPDGAIYTVYLLSDNQVISLHFSFIYWLLGLPTQCRYSERVKAETERFESLDLDDLEVPFLSCYSHAKFEQMFYF